MIIFNLSRGVPCVVSGWGQQEDCTRGGGAVLMFAHALVCAKRSRCFDAPRDTGSIGLAPEMLPASERTHTHRITVSCCFLPSHNNFTYFTLYSVFCC